MEYYNNILAVEARELIDSGIVSRVTYDIMCRRNQVDRLRRACRNSPALVSFVSLPVRVQKEYLARNPAVPELSKNALADLIEQDTAVSSFYANYRFGDGRALPPAAAVKYYNNAIVLRAVSRYILECNQLRSKMSTRRAKPGWPVISDMVNDLHSIVNQMLPAGDKRVYPHSLPSTERQLELVWKKFRDADLTRTSPPAPPAKSGQVLHRERGARGESISEAALLTLIHRNYRNRNAAKVDDEVKESYLIELLRQHVNYNSEQIVELYNSVVEANNRLTSPPHLTPGPSRQVGTSSPQGEGRNREKEGEKLWRKISVSTVKAYRKKYNLEVYAGRRGEKEFDNAKTMQVKRRAPEFPLYFWTIDGWDAELLYRKVEAGRTTYHHRPTVVMVMDACLKYPVGYAIGTHETPDLIRAALRSAVDHTSDLFGRRLRTQQIQSDRYAISQLTPYYEGIAKRFTPAAVGNSKSKPIEPYWNATLNRAIQKAGYPNWSGHNVTASRDNQPSSDAIRRNRDKFPEWDGVCRQLASHIEKLRAELRDQYIELYRRMPEEHRVEMPIEEYLIMYGETTKRVTKNGYVKGLHQLEGSGITAVIGGHRRHYDCFDVGMRRHGLEKWELRYDPSDMSRALAVNGDGTLRFMLEEKYVQPMALVERSDGDYEELERVRTYNDELKGYVVGTLERSGNLVRANMEKLLAASGKRIEDIDPYALTSGEDTLAKMLITDSRGQHKDRRNEGRSAPAPHPRPLSTGRGEELHRERGGIKRGMIDIEDIEVEEEEFDFVNQY
jgi:hypothetical protein